MDKNSSIFIAGHKGLVGSAVLKCLKTNGHSKLITIEKKKIRFKKIYKCKKIFQK